MANNVFGPGPNIVIAKETISFVSAGVSSINTEIIFLVDANLKSYNPTRPINGITGFVQDAGYYLVAKIDFDISDFVAPPFDIVTPPPNNQFQTQAGEGFTTEDGQPFLKE